MKTSEPVRAPASQPRLWPMSVPAYHALGELGLVPDRTELLYGQVFYKMSQSPLHRFLAQRLLRLLQRTPLPGRFVWQEQPITCGDSEPEPDLSIIRGQEEDYLTEHPGTAELLIEVCLTSHEYDRSKLRAYASAGIKECRLVLGPEKQIIEVHRKPVGEQFTECALHGPGGRLTSVAVPELTVNLTALFGA